GIERLGERSYEQRLLGRPALLSKQPKRLNKSLRGGGCALGGRGRGVRRRLWRRRNRSTHPFQRELAVEQLRVSGGALEIAVRFLRPAGGERGAPSPIISLGLDLERPTAMGIGVV